MSFTPYDWEDEERRDSERFAHPSVYDDGRPDPSEYMDYPEDEHRWQAESSGSVPIRKPGMVDENTALKGLLSLLFGALAGLMLWILVGAAVVRFFRWLF